jgi:hypothetical protein
LLALEAIEALACAWFAKAHPEGVHAIEKSIKFRQTVLEMFENLVCDSAACEASDLVEAIADA